MTRIRNVRNITKFKRSVKAISPVIATLLIIAITVVASLVAYAWVTGYLGFQTNKTSKAIQIQSFAVDSSDDLHIYVQNVGQGDVKLNSVYINDALKEFTPANVQIIQGETKEIVVSGNPGDFTGKTLNIKVTTDDGTPASTTGKAQATTFDVAVSPAGPLNLLPGGSSGFTSSVSGGVGTISYQWYLDGSVVPGATGTSYTYSDATLGTHTVHVVVTDTAIPTPHTAQSNTVSINVAAPANNPPTAAFSFLPANPLAGQTVVFTDASTDSDGTVVSWSWTFGDGSASTTKNPAYPYSSAGTYTVRLTVTDNLGATNFVEHSVTVSAPANNPPVLNPIGNQVVNELSQLTFTASANDVDAGQTLTYSLDAGAPAGAAIGASSGVFTWTPTEAQGGTGPYTITVRVTDNGNPAQSDSETITVTVNEVNQNPVLAYIGPKSVNELVLLTFTISATDADLPAQLLTYSATNLPSGATFNAGTRTFSWTPSGTQGGTSYDVTFTVSDGNGGSASEVVTITVPDTYTPPTVSIAPTSWTMNVGQSHDFTATASLGSGVYNSYQWYIDTVAQIGQTAQTFSYSPSSAGTVQITVTVTDSFGITSAQSLPASVIVNTALVAPTASADLSTIDQGQTSQLTSTAVSTGTSPYTYQWMQKAPGDAAFSIITSANTPSYNFATTGSTATGTWQFELMVTDNVGQQVPSNPVPVTVNTALVAPTVSANPQQINPGESSSLTSTAVTTGTSPYTYQWAQMAPGGSFIDIPGANSNAYTFVTTGSTTIGIWSFRLQVTDNTGAAVSSLAATVTVGNPISVTLSPTSWTMDIGQSKIFTATPSGGSGVYTGYQWYVDGVPQGGQTAQTFNYSPLSAGTKSITVTVSDNQGHTSPQSLAASVTVAASPIVTVTPAGPFLMDVGQQRTFTATPIGGIGTIHYSWFVDGSAAPGGTDSTTYLYTAAGIASHQITCRITDSASIPVTSPISTAVSIAVAASPTVTIAPVGPLDMQTGQQQIFTATRSGGSGTIHYSWFVDGSAAPGGTDSTTYTYTAVGIGLHQVTCTVTDTATVPVTSSASNIVSITVTVAFAIDSSGSSSSTTSNIITVSTLNCAVNDVVIVLAQSQGAQANDPVVSGGGLIWTQRTHIDQTSHARIWEYYAIVTGSALTSVTVTFDAVESNGLNVIVFGVSGANTVNPFDGSSRTAAAGSGAPTVTGVSTSNADDLIIGLEGHRSTTDATAGSIAGTTGTLIAALHSGSSGAAAEYRVVTSKLNSQSVAFGTVSSSGWVMIVEAIQKAGTGTFGYTTQGSNTNNGNLENYMLGTVFTSPGQTVLAQSITAYIQVTNTFTMKAAIYTLSGTTGTRVAQTQQVSVTTSNDGWVTFNFDSGSQPTLNVGTSYLLVIWSNSRSGESATLYSSTTGGQSWWSSTTYATDFPVTNTFSNSIISTYQYSIYCAYTY